ncbi:MAG: hypothetical protein AAFQ91_03990 [Cyanobacteria bacterium J06621_15]
MLRKNLFKSAFAVSLISLSILLLTINSTWGTDKSSQSQQIKSLKITNAKKTRIAKLIKILEKRNIDNPSDAARDAREELVRIGKSAVPQLIKALEQNRSLLTFGIIETLSEIAKKDASILQFLIEKLGDKNLQVRFVAISALRDSNFQTALIKTAKDSTNPKIRSSAMRYFSQDKIKSLRQSIAELKK